VDVSQPLRSHKGAGVREAIEAAGAALLYLPPYSPDSPSEPSTPSATEPAPCSSSSPQMNAAETFSTPLDASRFKTNPL
jgi:hypothetical protein